MLRTGPETFVTSKTPRNLASRSSLGTAAVRVGQTQPLFDLKASGPLLLDVSHVMPSQMIWLVTDAVFMACC